MKIQAVSSVLGILFTAALGNLLWANCYAQAQAHCKTTLSYKWQRDGGEPIQEGGEVLQASGQDETEAKAKLQDLIAKQSEVILRRCRSLHEDSSSCIATKLDSTAAVRANLSFTARKALEDAAVADCKKIGGACQEAVSSEPTCVVTQASSSAAEEKKDSKPEKGKKK